MSKNREEKRRRKKQKLRSRGQASPTKQSRYHETVAVLSVPKKSMDFVEFTEEASELAEMYLNEGIVSQKSRVDAQHIATATICRVDVLVSWNFKHIVNLERIHGYNSVNMKMGYHILEIRTPVEVLSYED